MRSLKSFFPKFHCGKSVAVSAKIIRNVRFNFNRLEAFI